LKADSALQEIMEIVAGMDAQTPPDTEFFSAYFQGSLPISPEAFVEQALRDRENAD
jgi:hypothetical protein